MVKAVLFDFWGTLVEQGVWSPVKQVKNVLEINIPFSDYIVKMERVFMTKEFSNLSDAFTSIFTEFDLKIDQGKIEQLVGLWNKAWMLAQPYPETEDVLQKLRKKFPLILVSNTDCFSVKQVLEKYNYTKLFDKIFLSYEQGRIKTDSDFFLNICAKLGIAPEECVMIGDSIQSDIIPAKEAGMEVILVDRRNSRNFHPKIKNLKDLEKIL